MILLITMATCLITSLVSFFVVFFFEVPLLGVVTAKPLVITVVSHTDLVVFYFSNNPGRVASVVTKTPRPR